MPPAGELPLDVGPAQAAVGLNGEVSQVPVDRVHSTLPLGRRFLPRGAQAGCDCEHSFSGFGIAIRPLLALDLAANFFFSVCSVRTDRGPRLPQPYERRHSAILPALLQCGA